MNNAFLIGAAVLGVLVASLIACFKRAEPSKAPDTVGPRVPSSDSVADENLGKAKQIFWEYACSGFHMRNGPVDEYKSLGGSEIHEAGWRKEYILHWSSRLSTEDLTALHKLHLAEANEALSDMEQTLMGGDDYARFWCAYVMADLVVSAELTDGALTEMRVDGHQSRRKECVARRMEVCSKAVSIWNEIVEKPRGISLGHREEIQAILDGGKEQFRTKVLDADTPEEYIANYAREKLAEAKEKKWMEPGDL